VADRKRRSVWGDREGGRELKDIESERKRGREWKLIKIVCFSLSLSLFSLFFLSKFEKIEIWGKREKWRREKKKKKKKRGITE
jgi:hypothetical protein